MRTKPVMGLMAVGLLGASVCVGAPPVQGAVPVAAGDHDPSDLVSGAASRATTRRLARATQARAIAYLRTTQDTGGGWSVNPEGPDFPGITGLIGTGMLMDPRVDARDPAVRAAVDYVLSFVKPDGTIHDGVLPTYNTAICVSFLSRVGTPEAAAAVERGVGVLRRMQWGAFDPSQDPSPEAPGWTEPIGEDHPFYGGLGYGTHGRPDASNTQMFVQAMRDAGVSTDDPAYARALVFLRRVQMDDRVNEMAYAEGSRQGGFVYATVPDAESVDSVPGRAPGQSQAGEMEELLTDGTVRPRLRAYGSMTYAGFKSLLYADLPADDQRVVSALGWIETNFTVGENFGLGQQGRYYGLSAMGRALSAWGADEIGGRDWRDAIVRAVAGLQEPDGGMGVVHERWMEGDRDLITGYALISVGEAVR